MDVILDRLEAEGRWPKFIYVVPNFSNPGGMTLPLDRRERLVETARERDLLIVEDNPYGLLRFEEKPLPTMYSLDTEENVVYLGSFSKIISPGIRSGWLVAPPPIYQKVVFGKQATDLCSSSYNQLFVHGFISSGEWREYVDRLRDIYRSRRDAMLEVLEQEFPAGSTWTKPVGGFFVWATLPGGLDTGDLLVKAVEENVAFVRGDAFYADGQGTSSMRLSFSAVPEEKIQEGIRRLGRVAQDQLDLYRAMGLYMDDAGEGRIVGRKHVCVLYGGRSLERDVSINTGTRVARALEARGHQVSPVDVDESLVRRLVDLNPDVGFIAMHGKGGEDGTVQELLEILGIPYAGAGVSASIRAMDKVLTKHTLLRRGLPTPRFHAFSGAAFRELGAKDALDICLLY